MLLFRKLFADCVESLLQLNDNVRLPVFVCVDGSDRGGLVFLGVDVNTSSQDVDKFRSYKITTTGIHWIDHTRVYLMHKSRI